MGFVKPNASASGLVGITKEKVNTLTKNDMLVFWGGANDVPKNNATKGFTQEINYLRRHQQTNCIVMTVPHRFDLDNNSCVNIDIKTYNRRLTKAAKHLNKVIVVNTVMERKFFTRHGLHLNVRGKEIMSKKLTTVIQEIIGLQTKNGIIPMSWKNNLLEHTSQETVISDESESSFQSESVPPRQK
jgi:hypothetical protein